MNSSALLSFLLLLPFSVSALAGSRASGSYAVPTDVTDTGGRRTTSALYTNDGSLGGLAGSSTAAPAETLRGGYVGQLYEVTGVTVTSGSTTVSEGATLQLGAAQVLDDTSLLTLAPAAVAWSVTGGPLTGISSGGLATAGLVFQNTPATARADFGGFNGTLNLTVLDALPDNFGSYAGDGIDDSWQVQYFGLNNPNAAPGVDFSGTGQTNLFKFLAGLDPLDARSRFVVSAAPVVGQPSQRVLTFNPVVAGRTYTVRASADLTTPGWTTLSGPVQINGNQGTFTDLNATGARRFYEVQITKP
ncbi:MAG: hypothetical protein JSR82_09960 [Verrucomicrobia bacterium]|nr:hypothetical protein [Verrucomicrobiota bacterium]